MKSLQLLDVLDTMNQSLDTCTAFTSICGRMNVAPEQLDEQTSVLDVLHKGEEKRRQFLSDTKGQKSKLIISFVLPSRLDVPQSVDISHYDTPKEPSRMNEGLMESELIGKKYIEPTQRITY